MTIDALNALEPAAAELELLRCCGSARWAATMAAARPFRDADAMAAKSDDVWWALDAEDWLEAFRAHPRIGVEAGRAGRAGGAGRAGQDWSGEEQSGVTAASRAELERRNLEYEARFGHIFIVCATGKSGGEMLRILERRMENNPAEELRAAAEEQRKITRIRLAKLLT